MKHILLLLTFLITGAIPLQAQNDGISNPAELYRKGIMKYLEYDNNE